MIECHEPITVLHGRLRNGRHRQPPQRASIAIPASSADIGSSRDASDAELGEVPHIRTPIDGNPLENINLVADPDKNLRIIIKNGIVYKNTLST